MPSPKKNGGAFIPALKTPFTFLRRSTTDHCSTGQNDSSPPQHEPTRDSTLRLPSTPWRRVCPSDF
ncbi:hypothetical protein BDW75DRAFT_201733, partial [Aspergillus navahoensis]